MTNYPSPQFAAPAQFATSPQAPKTSTRAGKVLTFLGIALTVVSIALVALIIVNATSIPKEVRQGAVATSDNNYVAEGLRAGRTYVIFPSVSYDRPGETSWSSYDASDIGLIFVDTTTQATLPVEPASFKTLNTVITDFFKPLGQFTAVSDGSVEVFADDPDLVPAYFEIGFVDQSTVDGIANKAQTIVVLLGVLLVVGFLALLFLIWGIILWAVRASRKRKLEQQARAWGGPQGGAPMMAGPQGGQPQGVQPGMAGQQQPGGWGDISSAGGTSPTPSAGPAAPGGPTQQSGPVPPTGHVPPQNF